MDLICTTCRQSFTAVRRWWMAITGALLVAGAIFLMFSSAASDRRTEVVRAQFEAEGYPSTPKANGAPVALIWLVGICIGAGFLIVGLRKVRACPHCASKATVPEISPAGIDLLRQRRARNATPATSEPGEHRA